jgi:hypothetical protein
MFSSKSPHGIFVHFKRTLMVNLSVKSLIRATSAIFQTQLLDYCCATIVSPFIILLPFTTIVP